MQHAQKNSHLTGKTILILGLGQIGEACAIKALKHNPKKIIFHTLTKQNALASLNRLKKLTDNQSIVLVPSWGDILVNTNLMHRQTKSIQNNQEALSQLLNYYYNDTSEELLKQSALYYIISKHKPNIIIDSINTATMVGYNHDPFSLSRKILKQNDKSNQDWSNKCHALLASSSVPILIRFTQSLERAIKDFCIDCYIKVSTTGLGGMGVNFLYTHGDLNERGLSSGILGKVAATGILHQLFWNLSHTPGITIKVVVPAALVGWQDVKFGPFLSRGKKLALEDIHQTTILKSEEHLTPQKTVLIKDSILIPHVNAGENSSCSLGEITAITALGQMECVTKEEVAQAVIESINGSTRYDLLTTMDYAALGPSFLAATQRTLILDKLSSLVKAKKTPSIATNNLGPTVSKHLFELTILLEINNKSITNCLEKSPSKLHSMAISFIEKNNQIRRQAVSLGLPILLDDHKALIGSYFVVPSMDEEHIISEENINQWATDGWIDLRKKQIKHWQFWLRELLKDISHSREKGDLVTYKNWYASLNGDPGEILGYIYSLQGGERRTEF